jgi:hypothetical protein
VTIWQTEPALISGLVAAGLVLAVSFGAPISDDQQKAVLGFTAAALMLLQAFVTRQNVVPTAVVEDIKEHEYALGWADSRS